MPDCLFCKIIAGDIPAEVIYQTEDVLVFRDVNPVAPTHLLAVPKQHISTINELDESNATLVGKMYLAAKEVARQENIQEQGYRTVINCGENAGQTVFHIHLHILAGRSFSWPPG